MAIIQTAAEFLSRLEREESSLLAWGVVDGGFSRQELEDRAIEFAATDPASRTAGLTGDELLEALIARHLILPIPSLDGTLFRTRMAETVRLVARLRQLFPDDLQRGTWRGAPSLVADFRFAVRPRRYPLRNVPAEALVDEIARFANLGSLEKDVILRIASSGPRALGLSGFQAEATWRTLKAIERARPAGLVVSAGTGTGKTLAFYLPALALIASEVDSSYWSKVVAIYPRVELLKDQCSQAVIEARRASTVLRSVKKRAVLLGALYGDTPGKTSDVPRLWPPGPGGWVCPYLKCPDCDGPLIWREVDLGADRHRLHCASSSCRGQLFEDEVVLTRNRMRSQRPDLLVTTWEMVNRCLAIAADKALIGLGGPPATRPRLVLLDEVHTYTGTTGAQYALVLRRWRYALGRQPVFVGLSATLRDARHFFAQATGLGEHEVVVIEPRQADLIEEGIEYSLAIRSDPTSGASVLATTIQSAMLLRRMLDPRASTLKPTIAAERLFAFTDNLDVTNRLYWSLQDAEGWDEFGRPRAPSAERPARSLAALRSPHLPDHSERFNLGQSWDACEEIGHSLGAQAQLRIDRTSSQDVSYSAESDIVVTTSSLDVGMDDTTVGAVIQHRAPREPAQFIQRRGRAGRVRGTRPWTAVVLADVGRDRVAYEEYEKLFEPELGGQSLPIRNRYVLRMQAALATLDWLATRLPASRNLRIDLSGPGNESGDWAESNARSRRAVADFIAQTLDDSTLQGQLGAHLKLSLRVPDEEVDALMYHPPRAILTSVLPTALRRLRTGWRDVGSGTRTKEPFGRNPLPEFIPPNLYSDLLLPEVDIVLPPARRGEESTTEPLTIIQAIQEFAPGRASRRYAVQHGHQRHWSPIPTDSAKVELDLSAYCSGDRMGVLRFREDGIEQEFTCVRPWTIPTDKLPATLRDTSNARPIWHTSILPIRADDEGNGLDIPQKSACGNVVDSLTAFTHELGSGVVVHRYSVGADATLLKRNGASQRVSVRFRDGAGTKTERAAVGLSMEADGLAIRFRQPSLNALDALHGSRARAFVLSLFAHLVGTDSMLRESANDFQLVTLREVALGALIREALRSGTSPSEVYKSWTVARFREQMINEIAGASLHLAFAGNEEGEDSTQDVDALPGRVADLIELCRREDVAGRLWDLVPVLWSAPDERWAKWYRARYASTLGAAFVEACYRLCPESGRQELALDFDSGEESVGVFWITENVPGGAGVIQSVIETYAGDPRRFFHLVEAALSPSEQEHVSDALTSVVEFIASPGSQLQPLVGRVRKAWTSGREPLLDAFAAVVDFLRKRGVRTTHAVIAALNARILRPGTGPDTDNLLRHLLKRWSDIEEQVGVEVDLRQFASWVVDSEEVVAMVNALAVGSGRDRAWRLSVVSGLLWPRGTMLRSRALDASHRFATHAPADWELVRQVLEGWTSVVELSSPDWKEQVERVLLSNGSVTLRASKTTAGSLKRAVLESMAQPLDAGYLLLYPRAVGWHSTSSFTDMTLELREVVQ